MMVIDGDDTKWTVLVTAVQAQLMCIYEKEKGKERKCTDTA
jgi:hypothetical protein